MGRETLNKDVIVSAKHTICLVGGASLDVTYFSEIFQMVEHVVAADGGANHLVGTTIAPVAVIGDMDSISETARATFHGSLHPVGEQETTDFEKALSRIAAPVVLAIGFTGGRMDHTLAVLNVLARSPHEGVILLDETDLSFVAKPGRTTFSAPVGTRISLMPLADCHVTATGLKWSFADQPMHPLRFTSSSNEVAGEVTIDVQGPLLITLPVALLPVGMKAVSRAP